MTPSQDPLGNDLEALFAAYRRAFPDREPGPDFMPELWRRIEARRSMMFSLRRLAQGVATAAAALCLAMALILFTPPSSSVVYTATYLEMLDDDSAPDQIAFTESIRADLSETSFQ